MSSRSTIRRRSTVTLGVNRFSNSSPKKSVLLAPKSLSSKAISPTSECAAPRSPQRNGRMADSTY